MIKILKHIEVSFLDYPDNISQSLVIGFIGCSHNCKGCQNPFLQDRNYSDGIIKLNDTIDFFKMIDIEAKSNRTNKIVLEGGDPLFETNIGFVREILKNKDYDFCIYTGYNIDFVKKNGIIGYKYIKCNPYIEGLKQESYKTDEIMQFASSNQELYNENNELLTKNGIYRFKELK